MRKLGELPKGWRWSTLGGSDGCCIVNPQKPEGFQRSDDELTSFVPMELVDEVQGKIMPPILKPYEQVKKGYTYFEESDVLLAKITPCFENGKCAIAKGLKDSIGYGTTEFHVIRPKLDEVISEWIWFFMRNTDFRADAEVAFEGSAGQKRVPVDFLEKYPIPIAPLEEQKVIASRLERQMEEIDRMRRAAERQLDAANTFRGAILTDIFSSDDAENWEITELEPVSDVVGGLQKTPDRHPQKFHVPYLRVENVQRGSIDFTDLFHFEITPDELERLRLKDGDLLVVEGNGSQDQIGRCAIFRGEVADCIHQNHLIRVRTDKTKLLPDFLNYFINSPQGMAEMLAKAETTSGLYNLASGKIKSLEISMPSTTDEQAKICKKIQEKFSVLATVTGAVERQLEAINALPRAYLREIFGTFESSEPDELPDIEDFEDIEGGEEE